MVEHENGSPPLPWYKDGLRFKCTECGKCCTGPSGNVWVSDKEMTAIAEFLKISLGLFKRKYVRLREKSYALVEMKSQNHDCVFLKDKKCSIYPVRPVQCRTYPWWQENLNSGESWKLAAESCEGINEEAPVVPYSQIVQLISTNENNNK